VLGVAAPKQVEAHKARGDGLPHAMRHLSQWRQAL
jgi:hypothetical protein